MQIKFLKDIVASVAGQPASKIVDLLYGKKNVNEFLISKKLGLTINQTRNVLYKLAASMIRKRMADAGDQFLENHSSASDKERAASKPFSSSSVSCCLSSADISVPPIGVVIPLR